MTNSKPITLPELSALWQTVPCVEAIGLAFNCVAAVECPDRSHASFLDLLTLGGRELLTACGRSDADALGQAQTWLASLGLLEALHVDFHTGDALAVQAIAVALRDACLGQMQTDYHRSLLARHCAAWETRVGLVGEWLGEDGDLQPWEIATSLDVIVESV
ncbi:MAG: hypothetical protein WC661_01355 [Opitutaceae bacterium]|jgi:hypothetical protein